MTASADGLVGYVRGQLEKPLAMVGGFFKMTVLTGKALLTRPFQWKEFVEQSWFLIRVAFLPTVAVSIPLTVLIIFTLNILLAEFGAADISGAGAGLAAVTQLGPLVTVLVVAGAGSTAICADLGARTVREEIDAMEVLGIDGGRLQRRRHRGERDPGAVRDRAVRRQRRTHHDRCAVRDRTLT